MATTIGAHQERQDGQLRPLLAVLLVELGAQSLDLGDVDLLDVGEVRDAFLGELHSLGDVAAQADDGHRVDDVVGGLGRAVGQLPAATELGVEVGVDHSSFRPGADHVGEIDAKCCGPLAHCGRAAVGAVERSAGAASVGVAGGTGGVATATTGGASGAVVSALDRASPTVPLPVSMRISGEPTWRTSPTAAPTERTTPVTGEGSSTVALSVITSTIT